MVDRWRKDFAQGELPFYLVEIAPYDYGEGIGGALLREAQFRAATTIAHSGIVCTNDLVYPFEHSGIVCTNDLVYPFEKPQIHPCQKREVGNRLAYLALNKTYGYHSIAADYPTYRSMDIHGDTAEIAFDNASDGFSPWSGIEGFEIAGADLEGFEIAGADRTFHPATATLDTNKKTILVKSDKVKEPVAVRYCFRNFQIGNLKNHRGMPVIPFRTDRW